MTDEQQIGEYLAEQEAALRARITMALVPTGDEWLCPEGEDIEVWDGWLVRPHPQQWVWGILEDGRCVEVIRRDQDHAQAIEAWVQQQMGWARRAAWSTL